MSNSTPTPSASTATGTTAASANASDNNAMVLTLSCRNTRGIVHAVSGALLEIQGNITESKQFDSPDTGNFFMRVEFTTPENQEAVEAALAPVRDEFSMELTVWANSRKTRTLIMCSKDGRTLNDLLFQQRSGTLPIEVPVVVSNHRDLEPMAEFYNVPFIHVPITKDADGNSNKAAAEARLMELVDEYDIELVVLARYMQILSDDLCRELSGRAINIHHSFLPAFKGARPYHQAHERGVKLIGATAHYVTADLDEGPIIEQSVQRVTHAQTAREFVVLGREVEGFTLTRAVKWHAEHRVLLDGKRTVVFS
ncbi:formyltetrahydrofolate deformylase [Citricoccus sp. GCM10030269]|uniref:formyltetrahydrofolate deformylase n=1 Tax=Citricoccus sp. GCM10030269 TaxID=3273388 RepID=UPI003610B27C